MKVIWGESSLSTTGKPNRATNARASSVDWTAADSIRNYDDAATPAAGTRAGDDDDPSEIDRIWSTDSGHGGNDVITTGDGDDIIIGGEDGEIVMEPGGLLIAGTNGMGIQTRYMVFGKSADGLFPREFAFSLDNLGHIVFMPWFSMHENDPEAMLLAELAGTIRGDGQFWPSFSGRLDELLKTQRICVRGSDGFLQALAKEMPLAEYFQKNAAIWQQLEEDGYPARAVEVLEYAGHKAWINGVGDIAIEPQPGTLPMG